jgi:hypothetical protein
VDYPEESVSSSGAAWPPAGRLTTLDGRGSINTSMTSAHGQSMPTGINLDGTK